MKITKLLPSLFLLFVVFSIGCQKEQNVNVRMPADANTLAEFSKNLQINIRSAENNDPLFQVKAVKKTVEDFGYDYEQTVLYWLFNEEMAFNPNHVAFATLLMSDNILEQLKGKNIVTDETIKIFETYMNTWDKPEPFNILIKCKKTGNLIKHEDMINCLKENNIQSTDIYDYFFQIEAKKLIRIKNQYIEGKRINDIEIIDMEKIQDQYEKSIFLKNMKQNYKN